MLSCKKTAVVKWYSSLCWLMVDYFFKRANSGPSITISFINLTSKINRILCVMTVMQELISRFVFMKATNLNPLLDIYNRTTQSKKIIQN